VQQKVGLPVFVENDANASLWAESRFGAARGYRDVFLIAVGTGIGASIMINGDLYRGAFGIAGEPGHYRAVPDGRLCGCGNRGCWERYASGSALVAEAASSRGTAGGGHPAAAARWRTPEGISGPQVTRAAREGDPAALRCFQIVGSWLGQGMADLAAIIDPGCFVIGGGVSEAGSLLVDPARWAYERALPGRGYRDFADVRLAELGPDAGLVGAADLAAGTPPRRPAARHRARRLDDRAVVGPEPFRGSSPIRSTRIAKPPTNAPIAKNAATAGTVQPTAVAISRYAGPPNRAAQAPLLSGSNLGSGGGGGGSSAPPGIPVPVAECGRAVASPGAARWGVTLGRRLPAPTEIALVAERVGSPNGSAPPIGPAAPSRPGPRK